MISIGAHEWTWHAGQRVLLLAPGPFAGDALNLLQGKEGHLAWTCLDSAGLRLSRMNTALINQATRPALFVQGRATRLPFRRHSFEAIISFEALYAIRPPWTVIAEYHRVLAPDGTLILFEPAWEDACSKLCSRLLGPGKRVYEMEEIEGRLTRADFLIEQAAHLPNPLPYPLPAYLIAAVKKENLAEPVPQVITTRALRAKQKKYPRGEELP